MSNTFEFYGICACMVILAFSFILTCQYVFLRRRTRYHRIPAAIRRLLSPPHTSKDTLLRSRASANARLVPAFGLTNTFVSPDPEVHSAFRTQSIHLFQAAQRDWRQFTNVALQAVELALPDQTIPFHTFVQTATLSTIIVGLLDPHADISALAANDLEVVSNLITHIWTLSKKPDLIPEQLLQQLNDHLRRLVPDQDAYPNPLDFVIPTWETLWRVVAVTLAHLHADAAACEAFRDLNENPSWLQLRAARMTGTSPTVENYIHEALRLHPPVRHITRLTFRNSTLTAFLFRFLAARIPPRIYTDIADIESAQRSASWGPDAPPEAFDAPRFLREPSRAGDLLAFGCGPLKCVASQWAPMAAAVITGAILNRVDGVGHRIVCGRGIGGREGWDGWVIRKVDA
ncbi:cytochrome P450 [Mycena latifolia]|nr:cytochrome P450 [Mycena latifolia]